MVRVPAVIIAIGMLIAAAGACMSAAAPDAQCAPSRIAIRNGRFVDTGTVRPLGLTNLSLGGGGWNYSELGGMGQLGVTGGVGINNIGLLVRIWGIVTHSEPGFFYVDDGSGVNDGSGHPGVRVIGAVPVTPVEEPVGCTVGVTGISSCFRTPSGDIARAVLTRGPEDVQKLRVP